MRHFNDGLVYTNEKCIGCNRCIAACPVKKSNISVKRPDGTISIGVNSSRCIDCGLCVQSCYKGARNYKDDMDEVIEAMNRGDKLSFLIDPAYMIIKGKDSHKVIGYLNSLPETKTYDVAFGAEISLWAHIRYIREHEKDENRAFIANHCSAVVNYIEMYVPEAQKYLIPIQSPTICTAIYAKEYVKDTNKLVLISPCPSKKDESIANNNIIDYVISVDSFEEYIKGIDVENYYDTTTIKSVGMGRLVSVEGYFKTILDLFITKTKSSANFVGIKPYDIEMLTKLAENSLTRPGYIDIVACERGCFAGAGINRESLDFMKIHLTVEDIRLHNMDSLNKSGNPDDEYLNLTEYIKQLDYDYDDFTCEFVNRFHQPYTVPESTYEEIFTAMHKDEDWKRHIDCGSCGYSTCREMVKCIAYGYNRMENCIHYMNDELLNRYYTDALTQIPNKEGFKSKVKKLYENNPLKTYVIGVVSLNQLNIINDLYGFTSGDSLIVKASGIASNFCKDGGGIAARLGAGEFLLCFENTPIMMERIQKAKTYTFSDMHVSFPLTFRAGLYVDKDRTTEMDTMINYASLARDKIEEDAISSCLFYNDSLRERLAAEAMVTSQMYSAIENKEFVAYFQPQFSHRSKKIVGAETLCRWVKPDGSVISPGLFIPIFEKNGFIKSLDKYMWELAFRTVMNWSTMDVTPVPISVNVSRVSLNEDDFVDTIRGLYEKYPIETSLLHFEITESAYSDRQDVVAKKVNAIRKMGFEIAMDDFGSGYSSLNVLKDMPLDILKLDMGFFAGGNADRGESIIRNVVAMVKEIDLLIVAEGVETIEQAEFLKHVGCDTIQGYLYARPMPQKEYEAMISNSKDDDRYKDILWQ